MPNHARVCLPCPGPQAATPPLTWSRAAGRATRSSGPGMRGWAEPLLAPRSTPPEPRGGDRSKVHVCLSHSLVIDTLRDVDPTRKCYRMVGGVLVERTVKEVLPALESNKEQINKIIETLTQQLQAKGQELNEFREKHNIRVMGEDDQKPPPKESADGAGAKTSSAGVLVS
uniref:Prefoldin subunit 2 n=1 Tax=Chelonoidis abingdonii TaxID=106734 RepID=A0A8C0GY37_CHEAB